MVLTAEEIDFLFSPSPSVGTPEWKSTNGFQSPWAIVQKRTQVLGLAGGSQGLVRAVLCFGVVLSWLSRLGGLPEVSLSG